MTNAENTVSGEEQNAQNNPGSTEDGPASDASAGQPENQGQDATQTEAYKALESKLGEQGQELGEYRQFFQNVSPLLEKLDQNPELVQAILDDKIDSDLAKAVYEGKVTFTDAQAVTEAQKQVEEETTDKEKSTMTEEEINKRIEEKADAIRKEMEEKAELDDFTSQTEEFINNTEDFSEYADEIDKWLDKHDVTDIRVAYYAVKGEMSEAEAKKKAKENRADASREYVENAQGGGDASGDLPESGSTIDDLVGGPSNPLI